MIAPWAEEGLGDGDRLCSSSCVLVCWECARAGAVLGKKEEAQLRGFRFSDGSSWGWNGSAAICSDLHLCIGSIKSEQDNRTQPEHSFSNPNPSSLFQPFSGKKFQKTSHRRTPGKSSPPAILRTLRDMFSCIASSSQVAPTCQVRPWCASWVASRWGESDVSFLAS